ncbi:DNA-binding transcriptional regulator, LysR family [Micromonospora rhizosphaerae]|uniref:DNA-binding transcriptional regulator, LysR family n=1 Tax=Micromonospora rhizosphaerae TaxID=568872 RepID=A0A1C6SDF5_9ACTN|nr:LysR substrate-binding domain-containing protein [Micromonospora rhizosphaerae]SCL27376.1 DNA-binding transcriptional regulator, LysR family [Micromonospora rhizosphaerae]
MKLAGVDLNLLVALDALLAERNVTRAAGRIGLSQPGMSSALGRLRKLFADPLLVREGTALVPTARAQSLVQPVREALNLIEHAIEDRAGFDPATDECTFRVSCSDYSVLILIAPLIRRLAAEAPGVTIQVQPRSPDPVQTLRDGETDLVIEPVEIMGGATLPSQRLFVDRWLCCVWDGNTQVDDTMPLETYLRLGSVVYSMGAGKPVALVDEHLARLGPTRRVEFSVESFLLAPFLLQGTDLVTLVLERAVPLLQRTAAIRLLEPPMDLPSITQTMWWSPVRTTDPAHSWVRARIGEVAAALDHTTL